MLYLEEWSAHGDAQGLALVAARHHAAVIIRQHHDSLPLQIRTEDPFAGHKEIIAIDQSYHLAFLMIYVTTPHILKSIPSVISISGYFGLAGLNLTVPS